jgi:molybdopterin-biosynthesis enzyme MoeA-like protein
VREDARAILASHYPNPEVDLNPARLRMARIPEGAVLIDNPVSKAPGFSIGNVHVMAGVPTIFQAMLAGLLPRLTGGRPLLTETRRVDRAEGLVAADLGAVAADWPTVSIGSYPFDRDGRLGVNVVLRATDPDALAGATAALDARLTPDTPNPD